MKIDRLDAHDRLKQFTTQNVDIGQYCQNIINQRPFGNTPYLYIFAHARTLGMDERINMWNEDLQRSLCDITHKRIYASFEQVPEKKIIWQPRLTKPKAQTNSMLFKGYPGTDQVRVIWIIPARELWEQYEKGNLTASDIVKESIDNYQNHRSKLEAIEDDDLSDQAADAIYRELSIEANYSRFKPKT